MRMVRMSARRGCTSATTMFVIEAVDGDAGDFGPTPRVVTTRRRRKRGERRRAARAIRRMSASCAIVEVEETKV